MKRLLLAAAALHLMLAGLAIAQQATSVPAVPTNSNGSTTPDTTANSQNRLSHVANATALAAWTNYAFPVLRDDVSAVWRDSGAACSAADGADQVQPPDSGHCWVLDPTSARITPYVFGAIGNSNGTAGNGNDDTSALQNWLNYGYNNRLKLDLAPLPFGHVWRTTSPLSMVGGFLDGSYCTLSIAANAVNIFAPPAGSVLFFDHPGQGLVIAGGENVIQNICTFRAQPDPSVNNFTGAFTPGSFDFDIFSNSDLDVRNVFLADPTKAVLCNTGRCWINGLKGHPLTEGIRTYALLDTAIWHDIHFWPYTAGNASNVQAWQYNNLISFNLSRMDNAQLDSISSIIQATCFKFSANPASSTNSYQGGANKLRVNGADCDGIGQGWGIYVDTSVGPSNGVITAAFTNFTTQTSNAPGNSPYGGGGIDVEGSGSTFEFSGNFQSTFAGGNAVAVNGSGNDIRFADPYIQDWGMVNTSFPAFTVSSGNHVSYGNNWPHFDFALNSDRTFYGGSAYTINSGGKLSFPSGTGTLHAIDITDGAIADVLQIGGAQALNTVGNIFINAGGSTDNGCASNTPSGKIGLCYSTDSATYSAFNKTDHAVTLVYQDQRAWPLN